MSALPCGYMGGFPPLETSPQNYFPVLMKEDIKITKFETTNKK